MTAFPYTNIRRVPALWRMRGKTLCRACDSVLLSFHNIESRQESQLLFLPCESQSSRHACKQADSMTCHWSNISSPVVQSAGGKHTHVVNFEDTCICYTPRACFTSSSSMISLTAKFGMSCSLNKGCPVAGLVPILLNQSSIAVFS